MSTVVTFYDKGHKYYDQHKKEYTSVTTYLKEFETPFDTEYWAVYKTLQNAGVYVKPSPSTREFIIGGIAYHISILLQRPDILFLSESKQREWIAMAKAACDKGNKEHDFLETSINESKNDLLGTTNSLINEKGYGIKINSIKHLLTTELYTKRPKIGRLLEHYLDAGYTIFAEKLVFSSTHLIAGKIDCLLVKDNDFIILDWKTNKDELMFTSGYYKKVNGQVTNRWVPLDDRFKYPLDTIQESKGNKYTLQLSLYAKLLELWNYKCQGLTIAHIRKEGDADENTKFIPIKYLKKETTRLLEYRLLTLNS